MNFQNFYVMSIDMFVKLPKTRGKLTDNQMLSDLTWLRVGGPAEYFFQPSDLEDLIYFL